MQGGPIAEIRQRLVDITINGKIEQVTLLEASLLRLGMAGASGNVPAAKRFLDTVTRMADIDLASRVSTHRFMNEIDAVVVENEALRSRYKQKHGVLTLAPPLLDVDARLDEEHAIPSASNYDD